MEKTIDFTSHEDSLGKYLQEIGKIDLILAEEEVELAKKIRAGDLTALAKLTKANLRFVVTKSKRFQHQGLSLPDLICEGNLGLIKAAKRFDETRGFKFISYAVWWIEQSILLALAEHSRIVRLPLNKIGSNNKIRKIFTKLEQKYEREPTPEEISVLAQITEEEVKDSMKISGRHVSMDAPLVAGSESNLFDVIPYEDSPSPESSVIKESLKEDIKRSFLILTEKEKTAVDLYYGLNGETPKTLNEISEKLEIGLETVRQRVGRGVLRLQKNSKVKNLLREYRY